MLYLNQSDFSDIPYYHNADNGEPIEGRDNVGTSGCGLCCAYMVNKAPAFPEIREL